MNAIRVVPDKVTVSNTIDMTKLLVKYILLSISIKLSETDTHALTIFIVQGYSEFTKEKLIETRFLKNKSMLANLLTKLRNTGILVKGTMGEELSKDFNIPVNGIDVVKFEILIKK